jgi:DNA invertase Pin-like site-specific DNA recombinase
MTAAAVYIRQTESGPPPAQQRAECVLAIASRGWTAVREFLDAESFTGRPSVAYGELLTAMRSKKVDRVVAYSAERMFRGVQGMVQVLEHARVGGVTFFLCREGLSTDGVHGAQLVHAAKMVAEIDQRRRSEMTALAHMRRQQIGLQSGRPRRRDPELDRMIHEMLDEGVPVGAVARRLGVGRGFVRLRALDRVVQQQGD